MSIRINGKKYINGTVVRANPVEEVTGTLNKIGIGSDVYEIQGGGGGSSYNGALDWSGMTTVATSLDSSGIDFTPDKDGVIIASGYSEDAFVPIGVQITGVSKEIYLTVSQNSYTSEYFPLNKGIQIHIHRGTSSIPLTDIDIYFVPFKIGYNSGDTMCEVLFNTPTSTDRWVDPVVVSCIPLNYDLITFEVCDPDGVDNLLMFTPQSVSLDTAAGDYTKGYKLQSGATAYLDRIENAVRMWTATGTTLTLNKVVGYRFGKGEYYSPIIYSTEEREIGVWIDGKPLYQKTFVFSGLTNGKVIQLNISNFEYLVSIQGTVHTGDNRVFDNGAVDVANGGFVRPQVYDGKIVLSISGFGSDWASGGGTYTLQYTKTTDTATSSATTPGCYDLNRPDLWPENKEIFFGNGLYGYRATGNMPALAAGTDWTNIRMLTSIGTNGKTFQMGGGLETLNASGVRAWTQLGISRSGNFESTLVVSTNGELQLGVKFPGTSHHSTTANKYDVWVTYTK